MTDWVKEAAGGFRLSPRRRCWRDSYKIGEAAEAAAGRKGNSAVRCIDPERDSVERGGAEEEECRFALQSLVAERVERGQVDEEL